MAGLSLIAKKIYKNQRLRQEFTEVASSVTGGMPRKTKKQFYKALFTSTKPEQAANANKEIGAMLTKRALQERLGKRDSALLFECLEPLNLAHAKLDALEDMRKVSEATRPARIRNIVNAQVKNMKIDVPPIAINIDSERIAKDVIKKTLNDSVTIAKRAMAYPINKVLSLAIPKSRKALCAGLMSEPRELFAGKYYKRLLEQKGIVGKAPKEVVITDKSAAISLDSILSSAKRCEGGFNSYDNTIEFTREMKTLSRAQQAGFIEHELLHAEQSYAVIQTYGIDAYISALKTRAMRLLPKTPEYKNCSPDELRKIVEEGINTDSIKKAFSGAISAPKIDKNSELGKKAKEYLDAMANYVPLERDEIFVTASKDYKTNLLEVEAYKKQRNSLIATTILENLNLSCV